MSPVMYNTYQYKPSLTCVNVGERKTVMIMSSDYIMEGMCFERYSDKVRDKTKHVFLVRNIKMYDRSLPSAVPPKSQSIPPENVWEKMREDIRKIQDEKVLILDRLLHTNTINMNEYLLLTLEINLSTTRNGHR